MVISTLSDDFNLASLKLEKEADRLKTLDLNYSMLEDGAESIGRIPVNQVSSHSNSYSKDKKKDDVLTQLLIRLQNTRLFLLNQMQELQDVIDQLVDDRDEVIKMRDGLNEFLDQWENTGYFDLDENNRPNNAMVLKAIKKWEVENNRVFDFDDPNAHLILEKMTDDLSIEELLFDEKISFSIKELDGKIEKINQLDGAITDYSNGELINEKQIKDFLSLQVENVTEPNSINDKEYVHVTMNFSP